MTKGYDFRHIPSHLVRRAHQRAVAIFMEEMADFDTTPVQFAVLITLLDKPGIDQVSLAAHVALDAATSGSVIGRLEARGWLRRENDTQDRRRKLLWITPEGENIALRMGEIAPKVQARLVEPLNPQQQEQLAALLSQLVYSDNIGSGQNSPESEPESSPLQGLDGSSCSANSAVDTHSTNNAP